MHSRWWSVKLYSSWQWKNVRVGERWHTHRQTHERPSVVLSTLKYPTRLREKLMNNSNQLLGHCVKYKGWASARCQRHLAGKFKTMSTVCLFFVVVIDWAKRRQFRCAVIGVIKQTRRAYTTTHNWGRAVHIDNNKDNANKKGEQFSSFYIDFFVCPPHRKVNNKQCSSRRRELHASAASVSNRLANEPFHSSSWMMLIADVYNTPAAFAAHIVLELSRCNSMGASDCCYVHTYEAPSHQFTGINFPSWLAPPHRSTTIRTRGEAACCIFNVSNTSPPNCAHQRIRYVTTRVGNHWSICWFFKNGNKMPFTPDKRNRTRRGKLRRRVGRTWPPSKNR